jgi:hypothetical protein
MIVIPAQAGIQFDRPTCRKRSRIRMDHGSAKAGLSCARRRAGMTSVGCPFALWDIAPSSQLPPDSSGFSPESTGNA